MIMREQQELYHAQAKLLRGFFKPRYFPKAGKNQAKPHQTKVVSNKTWRRKRQNPNLCVSKLLDCPNGFDWIIFNPVLVKHGQN